MYFLNEIRNKTFYGGGFNTHGKPFCRIHWKCMERISYLSSNQSDMERAKIIVNNYRHLERLSITGLSKTFYCNLPLLKSLRLRGTVIYNLEYDRLVIKKIECTTLF